MKTIGAQAKEFRIWKGWTYTRMAQEVSKHQETTVSRQKLTQLENAGDRRPHYLYALAQAMGTTSDTLLAGQYSPPVQQGQGQDLDKQNPVQAKEPDKRYQAISPALALQTLVQAFSAMEPSIRDRASSLLSSLARDPEGPWLGWLVDLLEKNPNPEHPTKAGL
jgi:transcriptional regulator with XRE-family HTH domain